MNHPFKRNAAGQRPTLRPAPGTQPYEVDPGIEMTEGDDDSDWALWEDSVQQFESGAMPLDPFDRVTRRDR